MREMWKPAALGLAAAMTLSVAMPAAAAPVLTNTTALKAAVPDDATQVRWRGRGWRGHGWRGHAWVPGAAAGLAAGALIGGAIAASPYYAYDPYYSYGAYPYAGATTFGAFPYGGAYSYHGGYRGEECVGDYDSAGVRRFC
jgi:hypothetical protein